MALLKFDQTRPMRIILLLLLFSQTTFCFSQELGYPTDLIDKSLIENANAVFRLDEMEINVSSSDKMNYNVNQVVTVLNKLGNHDARTYTFYDRERKIKNIEIYVYDALGKEIEHIKKKDFQDVSAADGFSLYVDNRLLQYHYKPIQYPYTLQFKYEVETSDTGAFPPWFFLSDYNVSVEKSRYTIYYAQNDLKPIIKEYNLDKINVVKSEDRGKITYEATNLRAIKKEGLGPKFKALAPRLATRLGHFHYKGKEATVNDWKEMGSWIYDGLLAGRDELPEGTKNKALKLVETVSDTLEKARIIYKYVQENTRYVSVQIGIGGLQPISAAEVDRVKYGDCKGLSNYTRALLKTVGVDSYYTVIEAGENKVDFDTDFADLTQGNHVILAIPYRDDFYWIDCTSQVHPFGFIGDFTDDRDALVVTPNGGKIVRTIAYLNEQNHQRSKAGLTIDSDGTIHGQVTMQTTGVQYDNRIKWESKNNDDIIKHYKEYWGSINNLVIKKYGFENNRSDVIFTENVEFEANNYATFSGERILFAPNVLNKNQFVPDRYRERKLSFEIPRGYSDEDEFSIELPKDYDIEAIPESKDIETEFGHYRTKIDYNISANSLCYKRSILVKQGVYNKEKYSLYRDFRKQIASSDNTQIVLVKKKQ